MKLLLTADLCKSYWYLPSTPDWILGACGTMSHSQSMRCWDHTPHTENILSESHRERRGKRTRPRNLFARSLVWCTFYLRGRLSGDSIKRPQQWAVFGAPVPRIGETEHGIVGRVWTGGFRVAGSDTSHRRRLDSMRDEEWHEVIQIEQRHCYQDSAQDNIAICSGDMRSELVSDSDSYSCSYSYANSSTCLNGRARVEMERHDQQQAWTTKFRDNWWWTVIWEVGCMRQSKGEKQSWSYRET